MQSDSWPYVDGGHGEAERGTLRGVRQRRQGFAAAAPGCHSRIRQGPRKGLSSTVEPVGRSGVLGPQDGVPLPGLLRAARQRGACARLFGGAARSRWTSSVRASWATCSTRQLLVSLRVARPRRWQPCAGAAEGRWLGAWVAWLQDGVRVLHSLPWPIVREPRRLAWRPFFRGRAWSLFAQGRKVSKGGELHEVRPVVRQRSVLRVGLRGLRGPLRQGPHLQRHGPMGQPRQERSAGRALALLPYEAGDGRRRRSGDGVGPRVGGRPRGLVDVRAGPFKTDIGRLACARCKAFQSGCENPP
mmetsp:Transcript_67874/g.189504  ORF Transcript_67874/g.189504 Transcript_67874/m.189504 type:complete len:301 (-) Transcript_67874:715-1617(-)